MARTKLTPIQLNIPYKFSVYRNTAQNLAAGAFSVVNYDTKRYDTGSNVDIVTNVGRFTATIAGFYSFSAAINLTPATATAYIISVFKNGTEFTRGQQILTSGVGAVGLTVTDILNLAAGDFVDIRGFNNGGSTAALTVGASPVQTYFSGFLVSTT